MLIKKKCVSECNNWKIGVSKCMKIRKEEFLSSTYSVSKQMIKNYYGFKNMRGFFINSFDPLVR